MTINREPKQFAGKIKEKFAGTFPPERLEALARQSQFVQRTSSKIRGQDFFALMTIDMLDDPAVSLGGLCDILRQHNPQAVMTPQALHQRLNAPQAVAYMQEVFPCMPSSLRACWRHLAASSSKIARNVASTKNWPTPLKGLVAVPAAPP